MRGVKCVSVEQFRWAFNVKSANSEYICVFLCSIQTNNECQTFTVRVPITSNPVEWQNYCCINHTALWRSIVNVQLCQKFV